MSYRLTGLVQGLLTEVAPRDSAETCLGTATARLAAMAGLQTSHFLRRALRCCIEGGEEYRCPSETAGMGESSVLLQVSGRLSGVRTVHMSRSLPQSAHATANRAAKRGDERGRNVTAGDEGSGVSALYAKGVKWRRCHRRAACPVLHLCHAEQPRRRDSWAASLPA